MTTRTRRIVGRRISFYLAAFALGYVAWCHVWETRIVPGYEQAEYRARHRAVALGYLPAYARKP